MPTRIALAGLSLWVYISGSASQVIQNPARPPHPRAGRVVTIQEELRIECQSPPLDLKSFAGLKLGPDGQIYVLDGTDQILRFDGDGRFSGVLVGKGGQESRLDSIDDFIVADDRVLIYVSPPAILHFGFDGRLMHRSELGPRGAGLVKYLAFSRGIHFFSAWERPPQSKEPREGWMDIPFLILAFLADGREIRVWGRFPVKGYARGRSDDVKLAAVPVIVPETPFRFFWSSKIGYLITFYDAEKKRILREFGRPYKNTRRLIDPGESLQGDAGERSRLPEYQNDIQNLSIVGGKIWVQTTAVDKTKGILIDVFDYEGRYLDAFFLKLRDRTMSAVDSFKQLHFADGCVFFADIEADGRLVIKKGRLIGID